MDVAPIAIHEMVGDCAWREDIHFCQGSRGVSKCQTASQACYIMVPSNPDRRNWW